MQNLFFFFAVYWNLYINLIVVGEQMLSLDNVAVLHCVEMAQYSFRRHPAKKKSICGRKEGTCIKRRARKILGPFIRPRPMLIVFL